MRHCGVKRWNEIKLPEKIYIPQRLITEENGYMAVIIDSEGNRVALHSNE